MKSEKRKNKIITDRDEKKKLSFFQIVKFLIMTNGKQRLAHIYIYIYIYIYFSFLLAWGFSLRVIDNTLRVLFSRSYDEGKQKKQLINDWHVSNFRFNILDNWGAPGLFALTIFATERYEDQRRGWIQVDETELWKIVNWESVTEWKRVRERMHGVFLFLVKFAISSDDFCK